MTLTSNDTNVRSVEDLTIVEDDVKPIVVHSQNQSDEAGLVPEAAKDASNAFCGAESERSNRFETTIYPRWSRTCKNRLAQVESFGRKKKFWSAVAVLLIVAIPCLLALPSDPVTALITRGLLCTLLAFLLALLAAKRFSVPPECIKMTEHGLSIEWSAGWQSGEIPVIPWNRIVYVGVSKLRGLLFQDTWLDFHVQSKDMSAEDRADLAWFFTEFRRERETSRVYVDLEGIVFSDEAKKLLRAIVFNVPQERIDPQLIELLNPSKQKSYTELWLTALSSNPDRLRTEALTSGTILRGGRYTIIDQIGAGGQGIAYRARVDHSVEVMPVAEETTEAAASALAPSPAPDDVVVLKEFILPCHGGKVVRKRTLDDVEREAALLRQIAHPHIVSLVESFVEDERAYLVLKHINGRTLRSLIEEKGPLEPTAFRQISMQLCEILEHLHSQAQPVIHRDFTPENIMIAADNFATLIDFNVAKQMQTTATKTVVGKHAYIPPEQFRGRATPQSDIYALGATMYFMLIGEDPEPISSSHPQEHNQNISTALDTLVARATAIDTQERFTHVSSLKSVLQELGDAAVV